MKTEEKITQQAALSCFQSQSHVVVTLKGLVKDIPLWEISKV